MLRISTIEQENEVVLHVETNKEEDRDELDKVYRTLMSPAPKKGGYVSSLGFQIAVQKKRGEENG